MGGGATLQGGDDGSRASFSWLEGGGDTPVRGVDDGYLWREEVATRYGVAADGYVDVDDAAASGGRYHPNHSAIRRRVPRLLVNVLRAPLHGYG